MTNSPCWPPYKFDQQQNGENLTNNKRISRNWQKSTPRQPKPCDPTGQSGRDTRSINSPDVGCRLIEDPPDKSFDCSINKAAFVFLSTCSPPLNTLVKYNIKAARKTSWKLWRQHKTCSCLIVTRECVPGAGSECYWWLTGHLNGSPTTRQGCKASCGRPHRSKHSDQRCSSWLLVTGYPGLKSSLWYRVPLMRTSIACPVWRPWSK